MERLEDKFGKPEMVYKELLHDLQKIRKDSRSALVEIDGALENLVNVARLMNREEYLNDHRMVEELERKLPYAIQIKRTEYVLAARNPLDVQNLLDLSEWIKPFAKTSAAMNARTADNQRAAGNLHMHGHDHREASWDALFWETGRMSTPASEPGDEEFGEWGVYGRRAMDEYAAQQEAERAAEEEFLRWLNEIEDGFASQDAELEIWE
uniref:Uncharacterized protein n=1 Tax=Anopheles albimanus TaxID=7167 RepID=A0A182F476_ANOAL